jgi:hypothetical protein
MSTARQIQLRLTNRGPNAGTLILEPWTGEYDIGPGETLQIVGSGDLERSLEIDFAPDEITVHWLDSAGAEAIVLQGGKEVHTRGYTPPAV